MKERCESPGEVVWDLLRQMVQDLMSRKPGGHLVESQLERLDLTLGLALRGPAADPSVFAVQLAADIERVIDDAVQRAAAFRPGHAYCHRCQSPGCEHSLPPTCRHVFIGYTPTGLPRWEDFAQHCLELKHPLVDQLYDDPPALIVLVHERPSLHGGMLPAFEGDAHELLGQLTAGFFPARAPTEEGRGVFAVTIQVAGSGTSGGSLRLGLNLLGRSPTGEALETLWERLDDLPWRRSVRWAQSALQTVTVVRTLRGARSALEQRVNGILQGLARRLSREQRARARKTLHAHQRHVSGERPTRKALDDARGAGGDAVLVDERSGTLVVLGERGRTHFFTPQGQLVSSVRYSREAIARKLELELWRRASSQETESFRARLLR